MGRARSLALFAWVFVSSAYFFQAGGWNQNSRFALVRAVVERGTIAIDAYVGATGDTSAAGGHFFTDKAPGQSLTAVPVVAAVRAFVAEPTTPRSIAGLAYAATVAGSSLFAALAALLVARVARALGAAAGGATFAALVYGLGSPTWAYATLFMGHTLAACCLIAAYAAAVALREAGSEQRDLFLGLALGLAAGWAVVTEYPAAPPAMMIALLALAVARGRRARILIAVVAGAVPCVAVLAVYHQAAFGSPVATPLAFLHTFADVREHPFHAPSLESLRKILVGPGRGLLTLAPVFCLLPSCLWFLTRRSENRAPVACAVAIVSYYLVFNASFATPMGGWSFGPRYLAAALPFLCLPFAFLWSRAATWVRVALAALAAVSMMTALIAVSTTAQPPDTIKRPLEEILWPAFVDGDLSLNSMSFLGGRVDPKKMLGHQVPHQAWNLGELLGLRGHASLLPLAAVWIACALALFHRRSRSRG